MSNTIKTIGERIRASRHAAGLTLEQLGELVGISHGALSRIEAGLNVPKLETLQKIGETLETTFAVGKIPKAAIDKSRRKAKSSEKAAL